MAEMTIPESGSDFKPAHSKPGRAAEPAAPEIERRGVEELRSCYDPEIPVNIYELGLIYDIGVTPDGVVTILMTLTSPACPVAGSLPPDVEARLRTIPGVKEARVEVTWDPPWGPDKMTDAAKLQLNLL